MMHKTSLFVVLTSACSVALISLFFVSSHASASVLGKLVNQETTVTATESSLPESSPSVVPTPAPTPPPAAVQPIDLTVSPITINLATDPGESVRSAIRVFNNGTDTEYLEIELAKFSADSTGANPTISKFDLEDTYQNWMSFDEPQFEVKAGEWKTVNFTFAPTNEAALGYYYAIIVKRQAETQDEATTIITGAPAILVLANVYSPNAVQRLELSDFSMSKKFYEYLPAEFNVKIANTGNIHASPLGNIFIDHGDKKDIAVLSINKGNGLVLPGTERTFKTSWADGFPAYVPVMENGQEKRDANGNIVYELKWDFSKITQLRIGKYTANLLMVYDNGERDVPIESQLTFWVIPWKILLGVAVLVILVILGVVMPIVSVFKRISRKK